MKHILKFFSALALTGAISTSASASVSAIHDSVFGTVGQRVGVDPVLLYAVALTESARGAGSGHVRPHEWALRVADQPGQYPATRESAVQMLNEYQSSGYTSIDIGILQINSRWHGHRVSDLAELLDAEKNIEIGADILLTAIASHPDRATGIGRYYTYSDDAASRRYGERVLAFYKQLQQIP